MKRILTAIILAATFALLAFNALAAETVTVNSSTSFTEALSALKGQGGTIVIEEDAVVSGSLSIPEQAGDLTVTGKSLTISGDIVFAKNTNSNVFTLDMPLTVRGKGVRMLGGFNSIVFTDKFAVTGDLDFYGGVKTHETTDGTVQDSPLDAKNNQLAVTELPYSITVNGGTFGIFVGGNLRETYSAMLGAIAAPIEITVNGGTFGKGVSFDKDTPLKLEQAFSISGMSTLADNAKLTINGGTFNVPIYAQGYLGQTSVRTSGDSQYLNSDAKYYAADGDITIAIKGGTLNGCEVSATQRAATYSQVLRGNYTVTVDKKATLADGMRFDATQVKTYAGGSAKASITYPTSAKIEVVRFDSVNGKSVKYDEPLRIAFIGDSITQGSNAYVDGELMYETMSYPAQLLDKMIKGGDDVIISNYGCSATKIINYGNFGYTLGLAYTLSMKETDADYVVVALGTNDSLACTYTYGMKDRFTEEYTAFIKGYEELPETDTVFGTCAIYRDSRDVAAVTMRGLQEKVFETLKSEGRKCTYIDLYALLLEPALDGSLLSNDLLHPDADGYTIYADRLYDALKNGVYGVKDFEMSDIYVNSRAKLTGKGTKESPVSSLAVAFGKAAPEATVHISGTYSYDKFDSVNCGFNTPTSVDKLTIVGDGNNATLKLATKYIFVNGDVTFDNITIETTSSPLYIVAGYNNVTFTETFKCDGAVLVCGFVTHGDDKSANMYNSLASVCSDRDCVININGGNFASVIGGNLLNSARGTSLLGTYSGDLVLNIGKGAVITNKSDDSAACGQNQLTGTVTVNIASYAADKAIREYAPLGTGAASKAFVPAGNTGTVAVNKIDGARFEIFPLGDINSDGMLGVGDALQMIKCINDKSSTKFADNYYGLSSLFTAENAKNLLLESVK